VIVNAEGKAAGEEAGNEGGTPSNVVPTRAQQTADDAADAGHLAVEPE
jgi:hypothetical protein